MLKPHTNTLCNDSDIEIPYGTSTFASIENIMCGHAPTQDLIDPISQISFSVFMSSYKQNFKCSLQRCCPKFEQHLKFFKLQFDI